MIKKVIIIDDDPLMVDALEFETFQIEGLEHQGSYNSIGSFYEHLPELGAPDLLLLDLDLSGRSSLAQLEHIKRMIPDAKVLIVTGMSDTGALMEALQKGANGFYLKNSTISLREAIKATMAGGGYIEPALSGPLISTFQKPTFQKGAAINLEESLERLGLSFTPREKEVAHALIRGMLYKEIADTYEVGINTVRTYVKSIYKKAGVNSKEMLVAKLRQMG